MSAPAKPGTCINRLPDHTDFYTCGAKTLPGNTYCLECRPDKLNQARDEMGEAKAAYVAAKKAYNDLLAEGVPK